MAAYVADPRCGRCGSRAVYIGIGPGAEPACKRDCAGRCPGCLSPATDHEPYKFLNFFTGATVEGTSCRPCGRVFDVVKF